MQQPVLLVQAALQVAQVVAVQAVLEIDLLAE
jgi:hypothetical protein